MTAAIFNEHHDPVKCPAHYEGDGETSCKIALGSMFAGWVRAGVTGGAFYWGGCAFKYLWRWPLKNKVQDLEKCRECLDELIKEVEHGQRND